MSDEIVDRVREKLRTRSEIGINKYGHTMMRDDLKTVEWLKHAQEEAMDLAVYLERIIMEFEDWTEEIL